MSQLSKSVPKKHFVFHRHTLKQMMLILLGKEMVPLPKITSNSAPIKIAFLNLKIQSMEIPAL
jgi:hypothetical protein